MKFGEFKSQVPKVGQKVYLAPQEGMYAGRSGIHEIMREYGFEQVERRNDEVWRTRYELPRRSWQILKDRLVIEPGAKVIKVE